MDTEEQLEKFRLQWKKELNFNLKRHSTEQSTSAEQSTSQVQTQSVCRTGEKDLGKDTFHYFPFKIVENLLVDKDAESDSKCFSESIKKKVDCSSDTGVSARKKNKNKRLKLTKLEDIFVDRKCGEIPDGRLLDLLISDIDEITEIPFFDISLPREVAVKIFQYLGIQDLCSCAQVSRSWRHLAEDELLWCRLCHRLGHEKIYTTCEKQNWKQIVRHNVERQIALVTNWKNRVGKLSTLEHAKGKILSAVHVSEDTVVAGYTSGDVKFWNLYNDDSCLLQPSSTSLILDMNEDGLQQNYVNYVATSGDITVAAYTQGNVDIWSLANGAKPLQTFTPTTGNQHTPGIVLSQGGTTLAVSYSSFIDTLYREKNNDEFRVIQHFDARNKVKHVLLYDRDCEISTVIFSKDFSVHLYQPQLLPSSHRNQDTDCVTEIHSLIDSPVDVIDFKTDQSVIGVATGACYYGGFADGYKVHLYDMKACKHLQTLRGHSLNISCMNLHDSPQQEVVTGSADRKVRVFDMRTSEAVQTLTNHSSYITCVQMDEWKVVSGAENGFLCVWDRRMATKLWELHNRHPVRFSHFSDKTLIVANISSSKFPDLDDFENTTHRRYRGTLSVYNFLADLSTKDVPEICLSTYDQPDASRYNIALAVPYDTLSF